MSSGVELLRRISLVAGEAVVLFFASRLVFDHVLRPMWGRSLPRRIVVGILRGPGNILHETGHAIGYGLAGYSVRRLVFFFADDEGRGYCLPGRPWAPWAIPWLATGFAALMPLIAGTLALYGLSVWLGVPADPSDLAVTGDWRLLAGILTGLDYRSWRTIVFLYLALSIGAELAPSEIDLRRSIPALLVATAMLVMVVIAVSHLPADAPVREAFDIHLVAVLGWGSSVLDFGIMALALVGIPGVVVAWVLRRRP